MFRGCRTVILRAGIIPRNTVVAAFIDFISVDSTIGGTVILRVGIIPRDTIVAAFIDFITVDSAIAIVIVANFSI
jgi:hypothetical protein